MDDGRPLCKCHGVPMRRSGCRDGRQEYRCSVKARESAREYERRWRPENRRRTREYNKRLRVKRRNEGRCIRCGRDNKTLNASCPACVDAMVDSVLERKCREMGITVPELPEDAKLKCLR